MALRREQTYLIAKYVLITFTVLTLIATFVAYGVVIHATTRNKENTTSQSDKDYWNTWRAVIITYLVIEDIVALVGLFGAIKENFCLTFSYGIIMSILWIFNFSNSALRNNNVFNYLVAIGVIVSAFYFARRIRQNQFPSSPINAPHAVIYPTPAVIQVSPSYIPNQSSYSTSAPPPPYSNPSQPQLAFKY